ncbi:hypothetical protein RB195_024733 [Necator americanus]|uniref:Phlebovirus glycoprotein G2 fusion domain-containing protein n=1 Tax=Necator americanus TaxID=51031 RepID=A0ABR1EPZ3_NECAM
MTMTSLAVPPLPTLNQKFITNDKEYAIWQLDTNPLLSCKSRSDAKHLKCDFSDDCRPSLKNFHELGSTSFFKNNDSQIVARIRDTASTEFVITFQGKLNRTTQQRELKRLRTAIPPLPTPDTLYDDMVDDCRNIMRTIETLDELRSDIEYFYNSNLRYGELEREAQILELKAEICKLKLQSLRQHLRLLFSVVPILIATKTMSALAWRAKMQEPQSYVRRDEQEKELLTTQKDIEIIVNDQLQGMNEFFTAICEIRSSCLNMERGQKESLNVRILETVQFISATVADIKEQMERVGANQIHDEAQPTTSSSTLGDNFSQTVESCQMATNEKDGKVQNRRKLRVMPSIWKRWRWNTKRRERTRRKPRFEQRSNR